MQQASPDPQAESSSKLAETPVADQVRVQPRGSMRRTTYAAFATFVISVIALLSVPPGPSLAVVGWAVLLCPVLICLAPLIGRLHLPVAKRLTVEGHDVVLERFGKTHRISTSKLADGWFSPKEKRVYLGLTNGNTYSASVDDAAAGQALLEVAGVDASKRTLRVRLGSVSFLNAMTMLLGPIFSTYATVEVMRWFNLTGYIGVPLFLLFFVGIFYLLRNVFDPAHLVIGADGIIIEQRFTKNFFPFEQIKNVTTSREEVTIHFVDGRTFAAQARHLDPVAQAMVVERINNAVAVRAENSAELNALAALDRGGRNGLAWREAMQGLLHKNRGYRAAPITREQIMRVLADPSAPVDRRLGAALALAKSGDEEAPKRIRIAAEASANQKVRIALESIAAGDLESAAIDEAAEEEAVARRTGDV